jgi:hypothetical protein
MAGGNHSMPMAYRCQELNVEYIYMGNVVRSSHRGFREMIEKLVQAGYLRPTQRNDTDAIAKAISRMKRNLRTSVEKPVREDDSRTR